VILPSALFAGALSLSQVIAALQPLIIAISIMAAALLVRLNRGMPTLEWKSLDSRERKILTQKIVEVAREYLTVLSIQAVTLAALVGVLMEKDSTVIATWERYLLAALGALVGLCVARMAHIVWRDYDIVRLQKKLIDDSADRETVDRASEEALSKVANIRASGLRAVPRTEALPWPEQ
jgi:hypothetical protein